MSRYDLWTHGVNTIVQFPERAQSIIPSGGGLEIEQLGSQPDNWLHIPIASPTILASDRVSVQRVRIRGKVDNKAVIEELQILVDGVSKHTLPGMGITGRQFDQAFNAGEFINEGGLVVSLRVKFLNPRGKVTMRGAGIHFEKLPV